MGDIVDDDDGAIHRPRDSEALERSTDDNGDTGGSRGGHDTANQEDADRG